MAKLWLIENILQNLFHTKITQKKKNLDYGPEPSKCLGFIEKKINPFAIFFQIFSLDRKQLILKLNTQELKMYKFQEGDKL